MFRHLFRYWLTNKSSSLHNVGTVPPLIYIILKNLYLFIGGMEQRNTIFRYALHSEVVHYIICSIILHYVCILSRKPGNRVPLFRHSEYVAVLTVFKAYKWQQLA